MKSVMALVVVAALAGCGASNRWTASEVEEPAEAAPAAAMPIDVSRAPTETAPTTAPVALVDPVLEPPSATGSTTTTAQLEAASPSATTTSTVSGTAVPEVDLDLSELDILVGELDGLLGELGEAMNQNEGEFTP